MKAKILIVEDNTDLAQLLRIHLNDLSFEVEVAHDGESALTTRARTDFDLVILDLMLPDIDGLEVCRRLRRDKRYTPILMLTARTSELDRVLGLETGADDYVTKPFSISELLARVKAILRRVQALGNQPAANPSSATLTVGELAIDTGGRTVRVAGRTVSLTAKEFDLLAHFARHPGQVFTRAQLLDQVWGYGYSGYEHTVNSHINRLRVKIEADPAKPCYVRTVWGVGYKLATPPRATPHAPADGIP